MFSPSKVCPSYPQAVVVPKAVDDDCLMQAAAFRQGGRFPVLSYLHGTNGVSLIYVHLGIEAVMFSGNTYRLHCLKVKTEGMLPKVDWEFN